MREFFLVNFKYILLTILTLIILFSAYKVFNLYAENRINERISKERERINELKIKSIYWELKSKMFEQESKNYKEIIEKSKQNITNIINKYDEKRNTVSSLNDDKSIEFLSERLNKKDSIK